MSKVQAIAKQIEELTGEEFDELCEWFLEHESKARDAEVESEAVPEELEQIVSDALAHYDSVQARKP
jgi:hypothetical protein